MINEEFGEVISQHEQATSNQPEVGQPSANREEVAQSSVRPQSSTIQKKRAFVSRRQQAPAESTQTTTDPRLPTDITREEETSLADFLAVGLSLTEARAMKENEDRLAEIKLQAREIKRQVQRGAITSRGANAQTRFGQGSTTGRRGGLTFN